VVLCSLRVVVRGIRKGEVELLVGCVVGNKSRTSVEGMDGMECVLECSRVRAVTLRSAWIRREDL